MRSVVIPLLIGLSASFRSRVEMQAEIAALHHQLWILQRRTGARPRLRSIDRILWTWLSRLWSGWRRALVIVKPETVPSLASPRLPALLAMEKPKTRAGEAKALA